MAPEALLTKHVSLGVDIWSLACTVLHMLTGVPPSYGKRLASVPHLIQHLQQNPGISPNLPAQQGAEGFTDMLQACFTWDHTARPTAHELLQNAVCTDVACHTCQNSSCSTSKSDSLTAVRRASTTSSCTTGALSQCSDDESSETREPLANEDQKPQLSSLLQLNQSFELQIPASISPTKRATAAAARHALAKTNPYARRNSR